MKASDEMQESLKESDFSTAFKILKRNPLLKIDRSDGLMFLNNMERNNMRKESSDTFTYVMDGQGNDQEVADSYAFIYMRMKNQDLLRGFNCLEGEYPMSGVTEVTPKRIFEETGLEMSALRPKQPNLLWQSLLIGLAVTEISFGDTLSIDIVIALSIISSFSYICDLLVFKGSIFESLIQTFNPNERKKKIHHEAGHFLISYLCGLPIRRCIITPFESMDFPELDSVAGTIYYDSILNSQIQDGKVDRSSINRASVVIMAGIAAEAWQYGKAEGGVIDENSLFELLTTIQPPWNIDRVKSQARWAVLQSLILLREHEDSYNALVVALDGGSSIGECIECIEDHLPMTLPSDIRIIEKGKKIVKAEIIKLYAYLRRIDLELENDTAEQKQELREVESYLKSMGWEVSAPPIINDVLDDIDIGIGNKKLDALTKSNLQRKVIEKSKRTIEKEKVYIQGKMNRLCQ
jgi:hypothetical protein